jgi:hypothetical protein
VECAIHVVTQFIEQIDPDSMVILAGDHGPESFGQLRVEGSEWTDIEVDGDQVSWTRYEVLRGVSLTCPITITS